MAEYREIEGTVEVPKNAGVKGFLKAVEDILRLPRVQSLHIDGRGKISYRHFAREGDTPGLEVSFDALLPYAIIRNGKVEELVEPNGNAAIAMSQLFAAAQREGLYPVALVGGANSLYWKWYEGTTHLKVVSKSESYGLPFFGDRHVDDQTLMLCTGYARGGDLVDTQKSFKLVIPEGYK